MSTKNETGNWPEHPRMSGFQCPACQSPEVRLATEAERFLYLRCDRCAHVWSFPERRKRKRRREDAKES